MARFASSSSSSSRAAALCALLLLGVLGVAMALPSGFTRESKYSNNDLTKFRFLPDGRMIIARRDGAFFIVNNPSQTPLQPQALFTYSNVDYTGERGLMSFVLDPNFSSNGYFYAMITTIVAESGFNAGMSIIRFNFNAASILGSAKTLFSDPDGYVGPYHYGGDLVIRDNQLYMTSGDKYYAETAQDPTRASTCIFRINLDGSIPSDNSTPKTNKACWAYGIRNGWRASYDSVSGRIYIGEVGGNDEGVAMEDIHIAKPGVNYGWPYCEGYCNNPDFASTCDCSKHDNAFYAYAHKGANMAIVMGYVNRGSHFPNSYKGHLFFGDYTQGWIKYLPLDTNGNIAGQPVLFDDFALGIINMEPGLDGSLWYSSVYGISRIYYNTGNVPPVVNSVVATYPNGQTGVPLQVKFSVSASDADGNTLSYAWEFGDGTTSTTQNPTKIYATSGQYSALVRVSDGQATSVSQTLLIKVGAIPVVTISSPANNVKYVANQNITLTGSATSGGSPLSASQLQWDILVFHDDHTHPFLTQIVGSSVTLTTVASGHSTSDNVYLIATLTATNAAGISAATSINMLPQEVNINLNSVPSGIPLTLDGIVKTTPHVTDTNVGFNHNLGAPSTACINGKTYNFASWSDGGAQTHATIVPNTDVTFTATYTATTLSCAATASCANYGCGNGYQPQNQCQCDTSCVTHGDCCSDYQSQCVAATTSAPATTNTASVKSCAVFGCGTYKASNPCQCDASCVNYGDCCADRASLCAAGATTTAAPATTTAAPVTTKAPTTNAPTTQASTGSCAAYGCGIYKAGNKCQCDNNCSTYGDCCADRASLCDATTQAPAIGSCAVYGCGIYKSGNKCQCDKNCSSYGDCCSDIGTCPA